METKNEYIEDLLFDHFAGKLTEVQEKELLIWLEDSEANKKTYYRMADWWATAHVPLFASGMKANFEAHFGNLLKPVRPEMIRRSLWVTWQKIAVVILLVLSVGITSYRLGSNSLEKETPLVYFETVTPMGSQSKVILPDGSVVWVNAGSSLRYSKDFNKHQRQIYLEGEAYFEVAPDTLNPFIVKSNIVSVRVLGTCFNVKAYKNDETIDVSLVSGKVNVSLDKGKDPAGEVELTPNRMLSYNKETEQMEMKKIDGKNAYDWTNGNLRFEEKTFSEIAKELERKYSIHIRIETEKLKKEVFTGSFSGYYSLNDVLHEIDVERKYSWKRINDVLIIKDK